MLKINPQYLVDDKGEQTAALLNRQTIYTITKC